MYSRHYTHLAPISRSLFNYQNFLTTLYIERISFSVTKLVSVLHTDFNTLTSPNNTTTYSTTNFTAVAQTYVLSSLQL